MSSTDWVLLGVISLGLVTAWGVSLAVDRWLRDWPF